MDAIDTAVTNAKQRKELRDQFAMAAPINDAVLLAVATTISDGDPDQNRKMAKGLAEWAFAYADAMLEARNE